MRRGQKQGQWNVKNWRTPNLRLIHFIIFLCQCTIRHKLPPASQLTVKNKTFEAVSQAESAPLNIPSTSFQHHSDRLPQST